MKRHNKIFTKMWGVCSFLWDTVNHPALLKLNPIYSQKALFCCTFLWVCLFIITNSRTFSIKQKIMINYVCVCVCVRSHHPRGSEAIGSTLSWAAQARQKGGGLWWEHGGGGVPKKRKWHILPPTLPYNRLGTPMSSLHHPYTTGLCVSGERMW